MKGGVIPSLFGGDFVGFKEQAALDMSAIFITAEHGESATYEGTPIVVIPEVEGDNQKGNTFSKEGCSGLAYFWIQRNDVEMPVAGDVIVFDGETYIVVRRVSTTAVLHKVECTVRESVFR